VQQQRAGPKAAWTNYLIFWEVGFLPGLAITAQVTENVYDSPTGYILLIPQGTRIYAELEGKRAGDAISFNGTELVIEEVSSATPKVESCPSA
jgi:hypothetical protein